jgi:hypothetical protein
VKIRGQKSLHTPNHGWTLNLRNRWHFEVSALTARLRSRENKGAKIIAHAKSRQDTQPEKTLLSQVEDA